MTDHVDVAIIGGGIAGLTAAYRLNTRVPLLRIALFDASDRLGGKILTEQVDHVDGQFVVEAGPDAFLAQKPWAKSLAGELGLSNQIIPINTLPRPVAVLKNGRPIHLPDGVALIAPAKFIPFVRSPLLGWGGKLRVGLELAIPKRTDESDESFGNFVRRRLGSGALDWLVEPLAAGIYNADPNTLSVLSTFPQFRAMEREHGSIIRGLRATGRKRLDQPPAPIFFTLTAGMQELVDALTARVGQFAFTNSTVTAIERKENGEYVLTIPNRLPLTATAVALAIPAAQASLLLADVTPDAAATLGQLRTLPAGTLTLAFRDRDITRPLPGYGLVVPRRERHPFNALTISSRKFDHRAPSGWTLLRLFFGGARSPETMLLDDDGIIALAREQLRWLIGVTTVPAFARCYRWSSGSPQYDVGHLDRVKAIEQSLPPGMRVVGSPYTGVGIPDIVRSASETVDQLIASHAFDRKI